MLKLLRKAMCCEDTVKIEDKIPLAKNEKVRPDIASPKNISVTDLSKRVRSRISDPKAFHVPRGKNCVESIDVFKPGMLTALNAANFGNVVTIAYEYNITGHLAILEEELRPQLEKRKRSLRLSNPPSFDNFIEIAAIMASKRSPYQIARPENYINELEAAKVIGNICKKYTVDGCHDGHGHRGTYTCRI